MRKLYTLPGSDYIHNKLFQMGTVVLCLDNGNLVACVKFNSPRKNPIRTSVFFADKNQWVKCVMKNALTEEIWHYHFEMQRKLNAPCYKGNYEHMMKHDRKKKCGSGGVRLGKFCGQVTDYECRKDPLHDFPRAWN